MKAAAQPTEPTDWSKVYTAAVESIAADVPPESREFALTACRALCAKGAILDREGAAREVGGIMKCPTCQGDMRYSIASNGHVWARCETDKCVNFIE